MITTDPYAQNVNFYPWQDAVEKYRVSNPQALIDTDFEYALQAPKWEQVQLTNNFPSVFVRTGEPIYTATQIFSVSAAPTPIGNTFKECVVKLNLIPEPPLQVGSPLSIKDTLLPSLFDGQYIISRVYDVSTFSFFSRNRDPNIQGIINTPYTVIYTGGFFSSSQLNLSALESVPNTSKVRAVFNTPHGLFRGSPIYVIDPVIYFSSLNLQFLTNRNVTLSPNNNTLQLSSLSGVYLGSFNVEDIYSDNELTYSVLSSFGNTATRLETLSTAFRARTEGYALQRWADGGVSINPGTTSPNAQIIRQTRKYFRYQSGKGIQFSAGIVFKPTYDVETTSVIFDRYDENNNPFVEWNLTTEPDNGFASADAYRKGATIRTSGFTVSGGANPYNSVFTVSAGGIGPKTFAIAVPYNASVLDVSPGGIGKVEVLEWRDATVRSGLFDDQNGVFFEYDGETLYVVRRSSTQQLAGFVSLSSNTAYVSGINTKFKTQLKETDYVVLKGSSYVITKIVDDLNMFVAPDYRGVDIPEINRRVKACKTVDFKVPQHEFNIDKLDGTGPSGYIFDPLKMQMIFIDYAWYGAGKIRFGIRATNGNILYFHEMVNNNINTEAYMRSGNLPARFEIQTKSKAGVLPYGLTTTADKLSVYTADASFLPASGRVIINNEYIRYIKNGQTTPSITEMSILRNEYNLTSLNPASAQDGFITFNQNFGPNLSHWGTSVIMDGQFDEDKSYLFTAATSGSLTLPRDQILTTAGTRFREIPLLSVRLGPSVDYGQPGDFGVRNLINRSTLTLKSIGIVTNIPLQIILRLNYDNPWVFSLSGAPHGNTIFNTRSEISWQRVGNGSLAQYVDWTQPFNNTYRTSGVGGDIVGAFFADSPETIASTSRYTVTTIPIEIIRELSNSVIGGRNTFPDGPDILTVLVVPYGPIGFTTNGFCRGRISWTEAQG